MRQSFHDAVVVYERRLMAFPSTIWETATETTPKKQKTKRDFTAHFHAESFCCCGDSRV